MCRKKWEILDSIRRKCYGGETVCRKKWKILDSIRRKCYGASPYSQLLSGAQIFFETVSAFSNSRPSPAELGRPQARPSPAEPGRSRPSPAGKKWFGRSSAGSRPVLIFSTIRRESNECSYWLVEEEESEEEKVW